MLSRVIRVAMNVALTGTDNMVLRVICVIGVVVLCVISVIVRYHLVSCVIGV